MLDATLVDRQNMSCDLVAPVVPNEVQEAVDMRERERNEKLEKLALDTVRSTTNPRLGRSTWSEGIKTTLRS